MTTVYETLERPLVAGAGAHGAARHHGRPPDPVAPVRRVRPARGAGSRPRSTSSPASPSTSARPKQLGDILFGKMGLPGGTKTKTGAWSTGAERAGGPRRRRASRCPRRIVDWRQLTKLKSTYTDALPGYINPQTGRVHTSYALASTHDRAAVVDRAEPAEHPGPHRGRPQDPHAPSSRRPGTS